ncbi:enoyl-CoA hydratase [Blastococcus colisei]|uniref:Enoyl-CoA hydratase n=1 Tax=Blastococcus colisei TaxID=1564162 RepID=A0A543PFG4_9ACTN|nr:enoyl-CoA hydratase-related protein [Blastococcus colisei]TQN42815.1 enoyl-CoA hydratase [Blastococcus colisei]
MSSDETLIVTRPRDGIVLVTLNRPGRLNALTFDMFRALRSFCDTTADDDTVRVVVLTGAGRGFCAGLDLDAADTLPGMTTTEMLDGQESWADAVAAFRRLPQPVIAAVNGPAAGAGFSLALAADIRYAAPEARFNAAFIKIGLTGGDCGSSWMLPRIVGLGQAYEILLTGRLVAAEEAARIGLVNLVVGGENLVDEALDLAEVIAGNSPLGVRLTKQVVQINVDAPSLEAALELENHNQVLTSRTADMAEALEAYREKRPPRYTGH